MTLEFKAFPKIPRLRRELIITEKIDGTNACVVVGEDGQVAAQSRTRFITPDADNFGFAKWVEDHSKELRELGPGYHYGEWWGRGIQRGYGLEDRRFSLFHTYSINHKPDCVEVVPTIREGATFEELDKILEQLRDNGSYASPGFMEPEGIIVFHTASRHVYKVLLDKDEVPKGAAEAPNAVPEIDYPVAGLRIDADLGRNRGYARGDHITDARGRVWVVTYTDPNEMGRRPGVGDVSTLGRRWDINLEMWRPLETAT